MQIEIGGNLAYAICVLAGCVVLCVLWWPTSSKPRETFRSLDKPKIPRDPTMWTWEEKKETRKEKNDEVD